MAWGNRYSVSERGAFLTKPLVNNYGRFNNCPLVIGVSKALSVTGCSMQD
jgi:hypothetical protein